MRAASRLSLAFGLLILVLGAVPALAQPVSNNGNNVITLGGNWDTPTDVKVDGLGQVFVTDEGLGGAFFMNPGCVTSGCVTQIGGAITLPEGIAEGTGTAFVAGFTASAIFAIPPGCVTSGCMSPIPASPSSNLAGVAVDSGGDLFFTDTDSGTIYASSAASGYSITVPIATGFTAPSYLALDSQNNLYVTDTSAGTVTELSAASNYGTKTVLATGLASPAGIAADHQGNLFVVEFDNADVVEILAGGGAPVQVAFNFASPNGIAIDRDGNLYVADEGFDDDGAVYEIVMPPEVDSVSPNSGPSAGGNSVTISGQGFTGTTLVQFVQDSNHTATNVTVVNSHTITATVPAGVAGLADVVVTALGGASVEQPNDQYIYYDPPTVTSLNPTAGPVSGGTSVTVTGTNLSSAYDVQFGGISGSNLSAGNDTSLTIEAPPGISSGQVVDVVVFTAGGQSATNPADHFTYDPQVVGVSPNVNGAGVATFTLTISGAGFTGATVVKFGTTSLSFTVVNDQTITATVPSSAVASPGIFDVTVTSGGAASATSSNDQVTIVSPPTVTSVNPNAGPVSGGGVVTIHGTSFLSGDTVKFGTAGPVTPSSLTGTQITAIAPSHGAGTVDITVVRPWGQASTTNAGDQFTYILPPAVNSVAPASGTSQGGTSVAIGGQNFSGATAVRFGAIAAQSFIVNSPTSISATTAAQSAGTVDVTVTTAGGTSPTSALDQFTFIAPPVAHAVSQTVAFDSVNDNIALSITGGTPNSVAVSTPATHGTATASGTSIHYTPDAGYTGGDTFAYTATNTSGTSSPAGVTITVAPPNLTVLYRFTGGSDGQFPAAPLQIGGDGSLYGTVEGAASKPGRIFRLSPPVETDWVFTALHNFSSNTPKRGLDPWGLYLDDTTHTLFGTTASGGDCGGGAQCGIAYSLVPGQSLDLLYDFGKPTTDASAPISPLAAGPTGALFGMSSAGEGKHAFGAIFMLKLPAHPSGSVKETVLYSFQGGSDGIGSRNALLVASDGTIYGVTPGGTGVGVQDFGSVFSLTPPSGNKSSWKKTVLYAFTSKSDGAFPSGPVVMDENGALYGVTHQGGIGDCAGAKKGCGTVYRLTPPHGNGHDWSETILYRFMGGSDGAFPGGPLAIDESGALYGAATEGGGSANAGMVFRLVPPESGDLWLETVLHNFAGGFEGSDPEGGVVLDANNAVYGVTRAGGLPTVHDVGGLGTIYRIGP